MEVEVDVQFWVLFERGVNRLLLSEIDVDFSLDFHQAAEVSPQSTPWKFLGFLSNVVQAVGFRPLFLLVIRAIFVNISFAHWNFVDVLTH